MQDCVRAVVSSLSTLKKRSEFLRVRGGASWGTRAFLLQVKLREGAAGLEANDGLAQADTGLGQLASGRESSDSHEPRFGFTVTKKMGNAVVRNRIRRRFKAALREMDPPLALADCDYVIVARRGAAARGFAELVADFAQAFDRVHHLACNRGKRNRRR